MERLQESERLETASAWFVLAQRAPLADAQKQELLAWLRQSPENARAMELVTRAWSDAAAAEALSRRTSALRPRPMLWAARGLAAVLALTIAIVGWQRYSAHETFQSGQAEIRTVHLRDGTSVTLAPRSRLTLDYSPLRRRLTLTEGGAFISVAADRRPLLTVVAGVEIEDIGTSFAVQRNGEIGELVLRDGAVALAAADGHPLARLAPGSKAHWRQGGMQFASWAVDAEDETSWRNGILLFDDLPLAQALEAFERYGGVRFGMVQGELGGLRVSGVFHAADTLDFLNALRKLYGVQSSQSADGVYRLSGKP